MKIEKFEDIESWQVARKLTNDIYSYSKEERFNKDFGLKDQIRRASVSIMANTYLPAGTVAEGFDSKSNKVFINFLNYSYRSASEVQSLLYVAMDQKYILVSTFNELYKLCNQIKGLIGGFIKYLKSEKSNF